MIFFAVNLHAASISWDGKNTTKYIVEGGRYESSSGSMTLSPSGGSWGITLRVESGFNPAEFLIRVYGASDVYTLYYSSFPGGEGTFSTIPDNSGTLSFDVEIETPSSISCNSSCNYEVYLWKGETIKASGSGEIKIGNGNVSGNYDVCGLNTTNTYTLSFPGGASSYGSHSWTISNSGWKINGNNTPYTYTGTANSITVTTPSYAANASLIVSGDYMCSNFSKGIYASSSVPGNPSNSLSASRIGLTCYYTVTVPAVSTATSYRWSQSSSFSCYNTTLSNTTSGICGTDFLAGETMSIYVKALNGCGQSTGYGYKSITFPVPSGECTVRESNMQENGFIEISDVIVVYENNNFIILSSSDKFDDEVSVLLYDGSGKLIVNYPLIHETLKIPCADLAQGMYLIKIMNNQSAIVKKIIKN